MIRRHPCLALMFAAAATLAALATPLGAQEVRSHRVRYDLGRSTVIYEEGAFSAEEMGRFALLVERGVSDIDALLNPADGGPADRRPITVLVREDVGISRSFRRTVWLSADRVRHQSAPYLHETTHILAPMRADCLWLSEGFASYVQSHVAERVGGYDGFVFSRGGNASVDRLARRGLDSDRGRAVLPFIGGEGEPPNLFEDREGVAQPLYVMSHSFVKFMVEQAGLSRVRALVAAPSIQASAEALTGRSVIAWKRDWLAWLRESAARPDASR